MSNAGEAAKLLGDEIAAERDQVLSDRESAQGEQLGLGLDDEARAAADAAGDIDPAELEDMASLPDAREIAEIQRELDCDVYRAVREHRRRQGKGGRKPGSLGKRNAEFRAYLLSLGPHPGAVLARVYGRPVDQLAIELGCTKKEALDRQIRCAVEAMPYIEGKMPANVNVRLQGDFSLIAGGGTGLFDDIEEGEFDELPELEFSAAPGDRETEENQHVDQGER